LTNINSVLNFNLISLLCGVFLPDRPNNLQNDLLSVVGAVPAPPSLYA
jgi:hypothetical protein